MRAQLRYTSIQKEDQSSMKQVTCPTKPITGIAETKCSSFLNTFDLDCSVLLDLNTIDI